MGQVPGCVVWRSFLANFKVKIPFSHELAADKAVTPEGERRVLLPGKKLEIDNRWHLGCTLANTPCHTLSSAQHPPVTAPLSLPPLTPSLAPTSSPCHVASMHVRSLFYLFLSCSINLSVQPDAGRARCIPNTKNNHFSVTGVGGAGKGVCVSGGDGGEGRGGGCCLQLTGIRLNHQRCS